MHKSVLKPTGISSARAFEIN